ncbi:MAG: hypothetical protein H6625_05850 [Bdellovibrionaceae bacterium]|nr:hypothetical protein [Pseudobdellovibrionaceae bacterium]
MKYLSLIILLLLVRWTWNLSQQVVVIPEETHLSLQDDLRTIITNYIQENLPSSQNLKFERMWTERATDNQVKATFAYSFDDPGEDTAPARIMIDGYAILNRKQQDDGEFEVWNFDELYILNNHIQFEEGEAITVQPETN